MEGGEGDTLSVRSHLFFLALERHGVQVGEDRTLVTGRGSVLGLRPLPASDLDDDGQAQRHRHDAHGAGDEDGKELRVLREE